MAEVKVQEQAVNFGSSKIDFTLSTLKSLLDENKVEEAKTYLAKYYIKIENKLAVIYYIPSKNIIQDIDYLTFNNSSVPKGLCYYDNNHNKKPLSKWFIENDILRASIEYEPKNPKFRQEGNKIIINEFNGLKYVGQIPREATEFEKKAIDVIFDHWKITLCNNDDGVFQGVKNWLCRTVAGYKNETMLVCTSEMGTGKDKGLHPFMKAMGDDATLELSNTEPLVGNFNGCLAGKMMVLFQEFSCNDKEWNKAQESIKELCTSKRLPIRRMRTDLYNVDNVSNVVLFTNTNCVKVTVDDRRFIISDINRHRVGDSNFWREFCHYSENQNKEIREGVYESLYHYCVKYVKDNGIEDWRDGDFAQKLTTKTKDTIKSNNLPAVWSYLKYIYVLNNLPLDIKWKDLYDAINQGSKKVKKSDVDIWMHKLGIEKIADKSDGTYSYKIEHRELYEKLKKYIIEADEYNNPYEDEIKEEIVEVKQQDEDIDELKEVMRKHELLVAQQEKQIQELLLHIEQLKKQNEELIIRDTTISKELEELKEVKRRKQTMKEYVNPSSSSDEAPTEAPKKIKKTKKVIV